MRKKKKKNLVDGGEETDGVETGDGLVKDIEAKAISGLEVLDKEAEGLLDEVELLALHTTALVDHDHDRNGSGPH